MSPEALQFLVAMIVRGRDCANRHDLAHLFRRGRPRFDGDTVSQDACRGPSPSLIRWNNHNCGYAARSRSLNPCERPPRSACGPGVDVISAGWLLTVAPDVSGEIFRGWLPAVLAVSSRRKRHFRGGYAS